jgi:hypothetical protein
MNLQNKPTIWYIDIDLLYVQAKEYARAFNYKIS